jgi:hypothetical protein
MYVIIIRQEYVNNKDICINGGFLSLVTIYHLYMSICIINSYIYYRSLEYEFMIHQSHVFDIFFNTD